mmetsp:Transcript_29045/g.67561  ORF Transcript_29045/g.67561 Transcript_29045/m.67561 type:complete len:139 (-) Transcript_29045:115-531(-)
MRAFPAVCASRLYTAWVLIAGATVLNLSLSWRLFSFWKWGTDTPIGPDKVVGLLVFSASTGLTLVLALVLAACGAPQPRRGGSKAIHFFKLAAITGILAGMQFWIMGRLIWWFLDARSPTRNLADDSPVLLASLPGEL